MQNDENLSMQLITFIESYGLIAIKKLNRVAVLV